MKRNLFQISCSLILILNCSHLVSAQNQSSLIPPNMYTPSTTKGEIQIIQKGKPTLTYKSYNDNNTIKMNVENFDGNTSNTDNNSNTPREITPNTPYIPDTYQNNSAVIVGVPQVADPATFPKDTKIIPGYFQKDINTSSAYSNGSGVIIGTPKELIPPTVNSTTPKTYADDNSNSDIPEEGMFLDENNNNNNNNHDNHNDNDNKNSNNNNNNNSSSVKDEKTSSTSTNTRVLTSREEIYKYYEDRYNNTPNKNTGLIKDSLLSEQETLPQGAIVGIRVNEDNNPKLTNNPNTTNTQFGYDSNDVIFKNPNTKHQENTSSNSQQQSVFSKDNFGFYYDSAVPSKKHHTKDGE